MNIWRVTGTRQGSCYYKSN